MSHSISSLDREAMVTLPFFSRMDLVRWASMCTLGDHSSDPAGAQGLLAKSATTRAESAVQRGNQLEVA